MRRATLLSAFIPCVFIPCAVASICHGQVVDGSTQAKSVEQRATFAMTDVPSAKALEKQIQIVRAEVLDACVGLEIMDPAGAGSGSGTIISKDGWILTAGHVCKQPDLEAKIYFANGTTTTGRTAGLHWNGTEDCGVVKFDPTGLDVTAAEVGSMSTTAPGDWVVAFGHTFGIEKEPFRPPILRLGRFNGANGIAIYMDAPLSPGDSGGGVFDLQGRLIGINSTAGAEPEFNVATTIDFVKSHLSDMQQGAATGEDVKNEREGRPHEGSRQRIVDSGPPAENAPRKADPKILQAIASVVDDAIMMTVGVFVDDRLVCFGTVADSQGFIITKASEVGMTSADVSVALADGLTVSATRMAVDAPLDLMLLKVSEVLEDPIFDRDVSPAAGALLFTVGRDGSPLAFGARSLDTYQPGRSDISSPYLGVRVRPITPEERAAHGDRPGVIVMVVPPATSAARAGVRAGDFITRIGEATVENQPQLGEVVRRHAAGEIINVVRVTADGEEVLRARLTPRPVEQGPSPSSTRFPASRRSSGFGAVIQHDTTLRADQMGGPLVDLDGRVIGVNIARTDRTKSYALASATVQEAITRMVATAKEHPEPMKLINPLDNGIVTRQLGSLIRLEAKNAEIVGTSLRLAQVDDAPAAIVGWIDSNDSVRWLVEFTKPGDYSVRVMQACPSELAGQNFLVQMGEVLLTGNTKATTDTADFQGVDVGAVHVESAGRAIIEIKTGGKLRGPLMNLHALELRGTS